MDQNKIKIHRLLRGYTQKELADLVDIGQSLLQQYEDPKHKQKPTLENAIKIALILGCRVDDIRPGWELPASKTYYNFINNYPALAKGKQQAITEAIKRHVPQK